MKKGILKTMNNHTNHPEADECYTPPHAIKPLIRHLDTKLRYYDPTSGISKKIVKYLESQGLKAIDSEEGVDFLESDFSDYDVIITNPPYSKKDKFIEKCYEIGKPFALLLPVNSLQGQKRGKMFAKYGMDLIILNKRVDFTGKGSPHFGVAWFCYKLLPTQLEFFEEK